MFPVDAVVRRVDGELVLMLGGGRALLLQLAHPLVARGVAEHSRFEDSPLARLQRTLDATYSVVFGTTTEAERAARRVWAVHERITGTGYRANQPELLLWVHSTLVDTALRIHARFLRPLPPDEAEQYYQESTRIAELFGVPRHQQPVDLADFRRYFRTMVTELSLGLTEESRQLAHRVLHPHLPLVTAPLMAGFRALTAGLLPPPMRQAYHLRWDPAHQMAMTATSLAIRTGLPVLPPVLRRLPSGW